MIESPWKGGGAPAGGDGGVSGGGGDGEHVYRAAASTPLVVRHFSAAGEKESSQKHGRTAASGICTPPFARKKPRQISSVISDSV